MQRRDFLYKAFSKALWGSGILLFAYPVISFLSFRKKTTRRVVFHPGERESGVNFKSGVYLLRDRDKGTFYALPARCTHLGCDLGFDETSERFMCPCHGSVFDLTGKRLEGPAKKNLEKLDLVWEEKVTGDTVAAILPL